MQLIRACRPATLIAIAALLSASWQLAFAIGGARADFSIDDPSELDLDVLAYADDDHVYAVTTQLAVAHNLDGDGSRLGAHALVDVVSAASVDVVSTASYRFIEIREEAAFEAAYRMGEYLPSASYLFSLEPDYESHAIGVGASRRLGTPDSVLGVNYALTLDTIGMVGTPDRAFSEDLTSHSGSVSLTQVLGPQTLIRVNYAAIVQQGYMEKAYRSVPLFDIAGLDAARGDGVELDLNTFDAYRLPGRPPEEVPDSRHRHAGAVRVLRYLEDLNASIRIDYRFYVDSWSVIANTVEPALYWQVAQDWRLNLATRFYHQTGADFWRREYVVAGPQEIPAIRTVDRALSPYFAVGAQARVEWEPGDWRVYLSAGASHTEYLDYLFLDNRLVLTSQLGVQWQF